jgi:RNA polymerase sigma-70 factor (ECF subfamily)
MTDDLDEYRDRGSVATSGAGDPADLSVADERRRLVLDALQRLPEEQRAALVLVDMEGYPVADAAAMLDCAVGTVKSRCSRGRARLAELLAPLLSADEGEPDHVAPRNPVHPGPVESGEGPRGPPALS